MLRIVLREERAYHYRTVKEHLGGEAVWVNAVAAGLSTDTVTYSIYPNPYITINGNRWTKHYYIGSERVASRTGTIMGGFNGLHDMDSDVAGSTLQIPVNYDSMCVTEEDSIASMYERFGVPYEVQHANSRGQVAHMYFPITRTDSEENTAETSGEDSQRSHPDTLGEGPVYFYHRDHLGSTMSVTDSLGNTIQQVEYTPWGEVFVEQRSGNSDFSTPYLFNGKELDEETGLYYYGARYYDPKLSVWYSVDNYEELISYMTPYRAFFNNPTKYYDPSGKWEWDSNGNLIANKGDNSNTLALFLGTTQDNAETILKHNHITQNNKGYFNIKAGDVLKRKTLWIQERRRNAPMVKNTAEAISHYFSGHGESVNIDDRTTWMLIMDEKFQNKHKKILSMRVEPEGYFSINMTRKMFHIGYTNVDYKINNNGKASSVTYTLFTRDGFWDPDFVDEKILGNIPLINRLT